MDVREHGPGELAAVAGSLFQDPETQVVMGTVRNELAFPLENRGESPAAIARGVEEAALALGIAHLLERPTHALSGGELQRVALAAALVGRPRLVLLDEPTSQLDPVAGDELIGLLRRLNEEWGTTILLAEHRLERCLTAADRVIAMADGRVACDADPAAFLAWAHRACAGAGDARRPAAWRGRPRPCACGREAGAGCAARCTARCLSTARVRRCCGRACRRRGRSRERGRESSFARAHPPDRRLRFGSGRVGGAEGPASDPARRRSRRSLPASVSR